MRWRPRIFISYSRTDQADALRIARGLEESRVRVFIDTEGLMVGEHFAARLADEIRANDGLVFLHTANSSGSEWCHAEIYAAHAHGLQILRIRQGDGGKLPDPVERLLSGIHYLEWKGTDPPDLRGHLEKAVRHARTRLLRRSAFGAAAVFAAVTVVAVFFWRWEAWQTSMKRREIIAAVENSQAPWTTTQAKGIAANLQLDGELLARIRTLRDDPRIVQLAPRLNAWQLDQLLSVAQERRDRWDLTGVKWRGVSLDQAVLADATIRSGSIEDFSSRRCRFAGVYLGPGPGDGAEPGLSLVDANFDGCDFWNVWIDRTQLLTSTFRNSKFRGADVSLAGMAGAKFYSETPSLEIVTPDLALFENSIIRGITPPEPGVMDLATPGQQVLFDGVHFVRVTFEGWFKPEWFRNSRFEACALPPSLPREALTMGGNRIE
jgi:uncharacterized protein YjbI with pentapeptide repeats